MLCVQTMETIVQCPQNELGTLEFVLLQLSVIMKGLGPWVSALAIIIIMLMIIIVIIIDLILITTFQCCE